MELRLFEPNEKQKLFLTDTHKYVAFGGARGGGKSFAVRMKAALLALSKPGIKILIVRKTYPELIANHVKPLKELLNCGTKEALARYRESDKEMIFPNRSEIKFDYCANDADLDHFQGREYDIIFIDEATLLAEDHIKKIIACCRGVNNFPKRIYYTCNPGGKSHAYIKRLFIDQEYVAGEYPEEYSFIQSLVTDNKALMLSQPEYVRQLEALPEALRKAWLEGDWNSFVGQTFSLRNNPDGYKSHRWTHVIEDFQLDDSYKIYRGFDFGYTKPFSVGWYAIDHYGRMYRFKEYYGCTREANTGIQMQPREIAQKIKEIEKADPLLRGKVITAIADPAIWQESGGESIADMMEHEGIYWDKGDHSRLSGLMQCQYRLAFDADGFPMFYVFKSCHQFIRTIPTLIYDEKHPEDIDTSLEDHIYDEWRYVCMANPLNPRKSVKWTPPEEDPLDLWKG